MHYANEQPHLPLDPTPALPAACTQAAFARLLLVSEALVSRWKSDGRLELDRVGRVVTIPTLLRLAQTIDQTRGGRRGSKSAGISTLRRIEALIASHTGARSVSALEARIADLSAKLEAVHKHAAALHTWATRLAESRECQARTLRASIRARFEYLAASHVTGELDLRLDQLFRDATGQTYGEAICPFDEEELAAFTLTDDESPWHLDGESLDSLSPNAGAPPADIPAALRCKE